MATIFAFDSFLQDLLDLNRLLRGAMSDRLDNNVFFSINGRTYEDIYEVVWENQGYYFSSTFGSAELSMDLSVFRGVVTGYIESINLDGRWYGQWGIQDFAISADQIYRAVLTPDQQDDIFIVKSILSNADTVFLSPYNDQIRTYGGNDLIYASGGNDQIDGGLGNDTVVYTGSRASYIATSHASNISVSSAVSGIDTLLSIERVQFADGTLVFDLIGPLGIAAYRLYGGALDRTPDEGGLRHWTAALNNGVGLNDIASAFLQSDEFIGRYGATMSDDEFVNQLYQNILNRSGEADGIAFWNAQLASGQFTREEVLVQFTQLPEYVAISQSDTANGYWVI